MQLRAFGRSGMQLSVLGFGCGAVGGLMVRGEPADQEGDQLAWKLGDEWLRIRFDSSGRIGEMEARLTQATAPPSQPRRPEWRLG